MEVILIENIEKLGKIGDVVNVKDGFARNYLIPKKKVLRASKENLKIFEKEKSKIEDIKILNGISINNATKILTVKSPRDKLIQFISVP